MSMGGASGRDKLQSDINVTPLVDIVLVLLIIFMVITPLLQMGYDVKVPPKAQVNEPQSSIDQVIVSLTPQNQIYLNKQQVTIRGRFAQRKDKGNLTMSNCTLLEVHDP